MRLFFIAVAVLVLLASPFVDAAKIEPTYANGRVVWQADLPSESAHITHSHKRGDKEIAGTHITVVGTKATISAFNVGRRDVLSVTINGDTNHTLETNPTIDLKPLVDVNDQAGPHSMRLSGRALSDITSGDFHAVAAPCQVKVVSRGADFVTISGYFTNDCKITLPPALTADMVAFQGAPFVPKGAIAVQTNPTKDMTTVTITANAAMTPEQYQYFMRTKATRLGSAPLHMELGMAGDTLTATIPHSLAPDTAITAGTTPMPLGIPRQWTWDKNSCVNEGLNTLRMLGTGLVGLTVADVEARGAATLMDVAVGFSEAVVYVVVNKGNSGQVGVKLKASTDWHDWDPCTGTHNLNPTPPAVNKVTGYTAQIFETDGLGPLSSVVFRGAVPALAPVTRTSTSGTSDVHIPAGVGTVTSIQTRFRMSGGEYTALPNLNWATQGMYGSGEPTSDVPCLRQQATEVTLQFVTGLGLSCADTGITGPTGVPTKCMSVTGQNKLSFYTDLTTNAPAPPYVYTITVGAGSKTISLPECPPAVTGVGAKSFPTTGGTKVTLLGIDLTNVAGTPNPIVSLHVPIGPAATAEATVTSTEGTGYDILTFILPPGEGANIPVTVSVDGTDSPVEGAPVMSYDGPVIDKVEPRDADWDKTFNVTVTGANFGEDPAQLKVDLVFDFDTGTVRIPATKVDKAGDTTLTAEMPIVHPLLPKEHASHGFALGRVVASVAGQNSTAPLAIEFHGFRVTDMTPETCDSKGGCNVTLIGTGFDDTSVVEFDGRPCNITADQKTRLNSTHLECTVPEGAGQPILTVHTALGDYNSFAVGGDFFRYPEPNITTDEIHVTESGPDAQPVYSIDVKGDHLATGVKGRLTLLSATLASDGSVECEPAADGMKCILPNDVGEHHFRVLAGGVIAKQDSRFIYPPPQVIKVDPATIDTDITTTNVTLSGRNFGEWHAKAGIKGYVGSFVMPAMIETIDWDTITVAPLPADSSQRNVTYTLTVGAQPVNFTVEFNPPRIGSVSPTKLPSDTPKPIVITGASLGANIDNVEIDIGGIECVNPRWVVPHYKVRCTSPGFTATIKDIRLTVAGRTVTLPHAIQYDEGRDAPADYGKVNVYQALAVVFVPLTIASLLFCCCGMFIVCAVLGAKMYVLTRTTKVEPFGEGKPYTKLERKEDHLKD